MPAENYYCPDNFFKKMTDLESPKKNNDCYFYYYSTCAKGDNCTFRHEPSALGCETMCSFWKEGKCLNVHCNFRHMELRKNRKVIPCYWESQPVGCLKAHCPFLHQNPRPSDGVSPEKSNTAAEKSNSDTMLKDQMSQSSERKVTAVDSLVVNFEEESDGESGPIFSPATNRLVRVKTLEEIKLEKIQAESAAYYSYHGQNPPVQTSLDGDDLRQRIVRRIISKQLPQERTVTFKTIPSDRSITYKRLGDDLVPISEEESLKKKQKTVHYNDNGHFQVTLNKKLNETAHNESQCPRPKKNINLPQKQEPVVQNIRIKTLAEIRAERNAKKENINTMEMDTTEEEAEVSSTSAEETLLDTELGKTLPENPSPRRKIKLRRKLPISEENIVTSIDKEDSVVTSNTENRLTPKEDTVSLEDVKTSKEDRWETTKSNDFNGSFSERNYLNKSEDEVLLLDDDDDDENVSLRAEEELLDEIDSLLDN